MGTVLIGRVALENGQHAFVTAIARPIQPGLADQIAKLKHAKVYDRQDSELKPRGMLAFGTEPNPDEDDGTSIGLLMDITRRSAADDA